MVIILNNKWLLIYAKKFDTLREIKLGNVPRNFSK